jgi:hypothetical protein
LRFAEQLPAGSHFAATHGHENVLKEKAARRRSAKTILAGPFLLSPTACLGAATVGEFHDVALAAPTCLPAGVDRTGAKVELVGMRHGRTRHEHRILQSRE